MAFLCMFSALAGTSGCKATAAELAEYLCNPDVDTEQCDVDEIRRMTCTANGEWRPIAVCSAPDECIAVHVDGGTVSTSCGIPVVEDATSSGKDATGSDTSGKDAGTKDTGGKDATVQDSTGKDVDTSDDALDSPDSGATDVPVTGIPNIACLQSHCPAQLNLCKVAVGCVQAVTLGMTCVMSCGGGQSCFSQCQANWVGNSAAFSLMNCGLVCAAGCGDGVCASDETAQTCPKDCKPATSGSCVGFCGLMSTDCHCDLPCLKVGDCCSDYAAVCGG